MWKEFEEIAGYEVSYETYSKVIEPMYNAIPGTISKQQFVKMLDKKAFALPTKKEMITEMRKLAKHLHETCEHFTDFESSDKLEKLAKDYAKRFWGVDWANDPTSFVLTLKAYYFEEIGRGCRYPKELLIGRNGHEYERITLVKA